MQDAGFKELTRVAEARAVLRETCGGHGRTERVAVADAADRVLAEPLAARRAVPGEARAAVDGFAVRATDTHGASQRSPVSLDLAADSVSPRTAVSVRAGGPLPDGADAVFATRFTTLRDGELLVSDAVPAGKHVDSAGRDVEAGQALFDAGRRLRPSDVALLRTSGCTAFDVVERPRVSVVPTGDELVDADAELAPGETVETNGPLVSTLAERWGGDATTRDVVADDETALRTAIENETDTDVVATIGGSSHGAGDVVADVVADAGDLPVHGVAMRPGHSAGVGVVDDTPVLVLPGSPVSCLAAAVQFLRPALAWQAGTTPPAQPAQRARLTDKLASTVGERTFARVRFVDRTAADSDGSDGSGDAELPRAEPIRAGGPGVLSSVAFADGWVDVPESREGIPAAEIVHVRDWERPAVAGAPQR